MPKGMRCSILGRRWVVNRAVCCVLLLALLALTAATGGCGDQDGEAVSLFSLRLTRGLYDFTRDLGQLVSVAAAGDVNLGNGVAPYLTSEGIDYPWADATGVFSSADLSFVNLECCIAGCGSPVPGKEFCFRGPADSAAGLSSAKVDVVSLANNHCKDYGNEALLETFRHLDENGVAWCGAGADYLEAYSPEVVEAGGKQVAFLAFNGIVPYGWPATEDTPGCATTWETEEMVCRIKEARETSDYVVVSFHWGIELMTTPTREQMDLAHLAVESGADLVLGHHPHVVQGFETYEGGLIAYSLGNFVFNPPRQISSMSVALVAVLAPEGFFRAEVIPMRIRNCRPLILEGEEAEIWMGTVQGYCRDLGCDMEIKDGRGYIMGEAAP